MKNSDHELREALLDAQDEVNRLLRYMRVDKCLLEFYRHVILDGHDILQELTDTRQLFCFVFELFDVHIKELERAWRQIEQLCERVQQSN